MQKRTEPWFLRTKTGADKNSLFEGSTIPLSHSFWISLSPSAWRWIGMRRADSLNGRVLCSRSMWCLTNDVLPGNESSAAYTCPNRLSNVFRFDFSDSVSSAVYTPISWRLYVSVSTFPDEIALVQNLLMLYGISSHSTSVPMVAPLRTWIELFVMLSTST